MESVLSWGVSAGSVTKGPISEGNLNIPPGSIAVGSLEPDAEADVEGRVASRVENESSEGEEALQLGGQRVGFVSRRFRTGMVDVPIRVFGLGVVLLLCQHYKNFLAQRSACVGCSCYGS